MRMRQALTSLQSNYVWAHLEDLLRAAKYGTGALEDGYDMSAYAKAQNPDTYTLYESRIQNKTRRCAYFPMDKIRR